MDPINGLSALSQILRRKIEGARDAEHTDTPAGQTRGNSPTSLMPRDLEALLRSKIRALDPNVRQAASVRRWVIAVILTSEFDSRLHNEPKFNRMLKNLERMIDADTRLKAKVERVMEQLSK